MGCGSSKSVNVATNSKTPRKEPETNNNATPQNNNNWTFKEAENRPVKEESKVKEQVQVAPKQVAKEKETNVEREKLVSKSNNYIDAGKFTNISFEEVPNLKPTTPDEMWAIVKGTSEKSELKVQPAKNRKGWRTIRLFVSSTFKDFHQEREVLVKEVFPDLRLWCEKRKLRLVECDLRWGVPKDATTEETIKICLGEIDRCYEDNVAPFFLNLSGERSGWIPNFGDLKYNLAAQYGWVYGLSVTEMETVHGAFRKLNPNALFMIRDIDDLDSLPEQILPDYKDVDTELVEKNKRTKREIKATFPERVHIYKAKLVNENEKVELIGVGGDHDKLFSKTVFEFFKDRIEKLYPLDPSPEDPLEVQRDEHETFLHSRGVAVYGRDDILNQIKEYYVKDNSKTPLRVIGVAGAGKSAVMAKSAMDACAAVDQRQVPVPSGFDNWKVFYHFVGATPGSTDLAFFLQRLTKEIKPDSKDVLSDLESLIQLSGSLLSNKYTHPIIIFVDAINQIDEDKQQFLTRWLPEELSPNVKVIVSTIKGTTSHEMLMQNKRITEEIFCGPLDLPSREIIVKNYLVQYNKRLDADQMAALLAKDGSSNPLWLTFSCEELRVFGQFDRLLDKIESLPDDLISLEEDMFSRFEEDGGGQLMIAALCLLEVSRHGLLETELLALLGEDSNTKPPEFKEKDTQVDLADRLMSEDATPVEVEKGTVEQLADKFSKMTSGTYVVKKEEKEKIKQKLEKTTTRKVVKYLPARDWAIIYRNLKPLLRPCGNLGEGRLDFYHRSLSKAVRKKYFSGSDEYVRHIYLFWHGVLASYFEENDDMDRKAEELPYHLENLMDNSRLVRCLLEWPIFNRLFSPDFSIDLIHFWQKGGGYPVAAAMYKEALNILKSSGVDMKDYADQLEKVIAFLSQCGQNKDAEELLETRLSLEQKVFGKRAEKMADIYQLMATCKSEVSKAQNYISSNQLPDERKIVEYLEKSLEYRKNLPGKDQRYEEALANVLLCFHLCTIIDINEDGADRDEARVAINNAMQIFEEANDLGHLADCLMTVTFVHPRGDMTFYEENEKNMMRALELSRKAYGERHLLTSRIYLNAGIMYEEANERESAYDYFLKHYNACMELYGPNHPRTRKATDTMNEPRYQRIKIQREREAANSNEKT